MSNVSQWSVTAASNNSAPPNGAPEGMPANTLNDVIREVMAAVARLYGDESGGLATTGSSNDYVLTTNSAHASLSDLSIFCCRVNFTNTGACTLNVDSLGAKALKIGGNNPASGDIVQDQIIAVVYNSNNDEYDIIGGVSPISQISRGGTGATSASAARANLGVDAAGTDNSTDVSLAGAYDYLSLSGQQITLGQINLSTDVVGSLNIASNVSGNLPVANGGTGASTDSGARANLGLGSLAIASSVNNANWSGTDLSVTNGGTGSSTASGARAGIGAVGLTGNETVAGNKTFSGVTSFTGATVNSGSASLSTSNDTADEIGFKGCPFNTQNGNYSLVLTDAGKTIYKSAGGAGETITVPANASVAFPVGTVIVVINDGGGDLSISITSDSMEEIGSGNTGTRTLADNGKAVLEKVSSTAWKVSGIGLS